MGQPRTQQGPVQRRPPYGITWIGTLRTRRKMDCTLCWTCNRILGRRSSEAKERPSWAVDQYPSSDLGMREAVSDFWADPSMQDQLIMVWQNIARYYANEPTIAGYDLLNEPMIYTSIIPSLNASNVDAFYNRTVAAIRAVDPNHIIFLEPSNFMYTINTPPDSKIVWEPHFYPLSYYPKYYPENVTALEADMAAEYQEFVLNAKTPMWIGEFGAFMTDSKDRGAWTQDALTLFSRYQIGWAWWAYTGQYELVPDQLYVPT